MNRVKFTDLPRPFVCALVQQPTLEDTIAMMHQSDYDGAQAIGVDLCRMKDVSDDDLRKIMRCTTKPVYAMCYRYGDDVRRRTYSAGSCEALVRPFRRSH